MDGSRPSLARMRAFQLLSNSWACNCSIVVVSTLLWGLCWSSDNIWREFARLHESSYKASVISASMRMPLKLSCSSPWSCLNLKIRLVTADGEGIYRMLSFEEVVAVLYVWKLELRLPTRSMLPVIQVRCTWTWVPNEGFEKQSCRARRWFETDIHRTLLLLFSSPCALSYSYLSILLPYLIPHHHAWNYQAKQQLGRRI